MEMIEMFVPRGKDYILDYVSKHPEVECCGLQVGFNEFIIMQNAANEPGKYFSFHNCETLEAYLQFGPKIIGIWHSHPTGRETPSSTDLEFHVPGMNLIIIANGKMINHGIPTRQDPADSIPESTGTVGNPYTL